MLQLSRGGSGDASIDGRLDAASAALSSGVVLALTNGVLTAAQVDADTSLSAALKTELKGGLDATNSEGASAVKYTTASDRVAWVDAGPHKMHATLRGVVRPMLLLANERFEAPSDRIETWLRFRSTDVQVLNAPVPGVNKIVNINSHASVSNNTLGRAAPAQIIGQSIGASSANPLGKVRFGRYSDRLPLSVIDYCWDAHLIVDALSNYDWERGTGGAAADGEGFTVSVYYRRAGPAGQQTLISVGNAETAPWSVTLPSSEDGNSIGARVNLFGGSEPQGFQGIAEVGDWHHVAITYDRELDVVSMFVDGQQAAVRGAGPLSTTSTPLIIGSSSVANPGSQRFCGQIHDVRVYGRPLSRAETRSVWAEMTHDLYFGDDAESDCVVSDWGEWSECTAVGGDDVALGDVADAFVPGTEVRTRTRTRLVGSKGCPTLMEADICDAGIIVEPLDLEMTAELGGEMSIRLATPPAIGQTAVVELDNVVASNSFSLSECRLSFTSANWNVSQTVRVTAREAVFNTGTQSFDLILRAYNYSVGIAYPPGIGVTTLVNGSQLVDPETGLLLTNANGGGNK
jgi:hypothetical protein